MVCARPRQRDRQDQARREAQLVKTLLRIISYLKPYWVRLILVYAALAIGMALQLAIPIVLGRAIDHGIVGRDLDYLLRAVLLSIGLAWLFRIRGDAGRGRWDALWDDEDEDDEDPGDDDGPSGGTPGESARADAAVDPARVS